jgi:hypothetical protein
MDRFRCKTCLFHVVSNLWHMAKFGFCTAGILAFLSMPVCGQGLLNDDFSARASLAQNRLSSAQSYSGSLNSNVSAGSDALVFTGGIFAPGTPGTFTVDDVNASVKSLPEPPGLPEPAGLVPEPSTLSMVSIAFLSFLGINFFRRRQNV